MGWFNTVCSGISRCAGDALSWGKRNLIDPVASKVGVAVLRPILAGALGFFGGQSFFLSLAQFGLELGVSKSCLADDPEHCVFELDNWGAAEITSFIFAFGAFIAMASSRWPAMASNVRQRRNQQFARSNDFPSPQAEVAYTRLETAALWASGATAIISGGLAGITLLQRCSDQHHNGSENPFLIFNGGLEALVFVAGGFVFLSPLLDFLLEGMVPKHKRVLQRLPEDKRNILNFRQLKFQDHTVLVASSALYGFYLYHVFSNMLQAWSASPAVAEGVAGVAAITTMVVSLPVTLLGRIAGQKLQADDSLTPYLADEKARAFCYQACVEVLTEIKDTGNISGVKSALQTALSTTPTTPGEFLNNFKAALNNPELSLAKQALLDKLNGPQNALNPSCLQLGFEQKILIIIPGLGLLADLLQYGSSVSVSLFTLLSTFFNLLSHIPKADVISANHLYMKIGIGVVSLPVAIAATYYFYYYSIKPGAEALVNKAAGSCHCASFDDEYVDGESDALLASTNGVYGATDRFTLHAVHTIGGMTPPSLSLDVLAEPEWNLGATRF